jgi:hypothetical protein
MIPFPEAVVAFTGACEIAGALGLLVAQTHRWAGRMLEVAGAGDVAFLAADDLVFEANRDGRGPIADVRQRMGQQLGR